VEQMTSTQKKMLRYVTIRYGWKQALRVCEFCLEGKRVSTSSFPDCIVVSGTHASPREVQHQPKIICLTIHFYRNCYILLAHVAFLKRFNWVVSHAPWFPEVLVPPYYKLCNLCEINTRENRAEDTRTSGNQGIELTRKYSAEWFSSIIWLI
jgi:hypothetical protein